MHAAIKQKNRLGTRDGSPRSWRAMTAWGLALVLAMAVTGFVHARIPPVQNRQPGGAFVPEPLVARLLSVGFDSVVADYYWLKAVQVAGGRESARRDQGTYLGRLIDLVTTLNPHVGHPYRFAAIWLTASEAEVRHANRLLRRGIAHHPEDWRNLFYLGFNHFYYLGDHDRAADVLAAASAIEGSPAYLSRLVARLRAESGGLDVAEGLLREWVREAGDDAARAGYLEALDEIEIERRARFLDSARVAFRHARGRDILAVSELALPPEPILVRLPDADPSSVSTGLKSGSAWQIDPETDAIVSSYYGRRYALNFTSDRVIRIREWQRATPQVAERATEEEG